MLEAAFLYSTDLTPTVTSFSPVFGPKQGGTVITFKGQNLLPGSTLQDSYDGWFSEGSNPSVENSTGTKFGASNDDSVGSVVKRNTCNYHHLSGKAFAHGRTLIILNRSRYIQKSGQNFPLFVGRSCWSCQIGSLDVHLNTHRFVSCRDCLALPQSLF